MSPRADAERNRARILEAADEAFATGGLSVTTDQIGRRAGVGAGTMFRHFPTKDQLVEAVLAHRIQRLADEARDLPGDEAFFGFLSRLVEHVTVNLALRDALTHDAGPAMDEAKRDLLHAGGALLDRAQAAGAVRADVTAADVRALVAGCVAMERAGGGPAGRLTALLCDGLRPRSGARSAPAGPASGSGAGIRRPGAGAPRPARRTTR